MNKMYHELPTIVLSFPLVVTTRYYTPKTLFESTRTLDHAETHLQLFFLTDFAHQRREGLPRHFRLGLLDSTTVYLKPHKRILFSW